MRVRLAKTLIAIGKYVWCCLAPVNRAPLRTSRGPPRVTAWLRHDPANAAEALDPTGFHFFDKTTWFFSHVVIGLRETDDYCAAARIGMCDLRKLRTRLIMRALSSGGSRHGKTVMSAFGANDATSIEVYSGCDGVSSGKTRIGARQFSMNSRGTL
jgi:hypothetical protein